MNIFAIGDLHLSFDENIKKPMDIFGPRWVNHHERLKENWEAMVNPKDVVIIPGDVSWGLRQEEAMADLEWLHRLPGHKVVTKGNHDLWWTSVSRLNQLYDDVTFLQNHSYDTGTGIFICGTRGWICPGTENFDDHDRKIYERELIRLRFSLEEARMNGAERIVASLHYPPTNDKMQTSGFTELLVEYGVKDCVYGHLHGTDAFKNGIKGILGGVEYKLVSLDYLEGKPEWILEN